MISLISASEMKVPCFQGSINYEVSLFNSLSLRNLFALWGTAGSHMKILKICMILVYI